VGAHTPRLEPIMDFMTVIIVVVAVALVVYVYKNKDKWLG